MNTSPQDQQASGSTLWESVLRNVSSPIVPKHTVHSAARHGRGQGSHMGTSKLERVTSFDEHYATYSDDSDDEEHHHHRRQLGEQEHKTSTMMEASAQAESGMNTETDAKPGSAPNAYDGTGATARAEGATILNDDVPSTHRVDTRDYNPGSNAGASARAVVRDGTSCVSDFMSTNTSHGSTNNTQSIGEAPASAEQQPKPAFPAGHRRRRRHNRNQTGSMDGSLGASLASIDEVEEEGGSGSGSFTGVVEARKRQQKHSVTKDGAVKEQEQNVGEHGKEEQCGSQRSNTESHEALREAKRQQQRAALTAAMAARSAADTAMRASMSARTAAKRAEKRRKKKAERMPDVVEVSFDEPGPVGLKFRDNAAETEEVMGVYVRFVAEGKQADAHNINVNDKLVAVNHESVRGKTTGEVMKLLKKHGSKRPLQMAFELPLESEDDDDDEMATLTNSDDDVDEEDDGFLTPTDERDVPNADIQAKNAEAAAKAAADIQGIIVSRIPPGRGPRLSRSRTPGSSLTNGSGSLQRGRGEGYASQRYGQSFSSVNDVEGGFETIEPNADVPVELGGTGAAARSCVEDEKARSISQRSRPMFDAHIDETEANVILDTRYDGEKLFEVRFSSAALGMGFNKLRNEGLFIVNKVAGQAKARGVEPGDIIIEVGQVAAASTMTKAALANMIRSAPRPLEIRFRRPAERFDVENESFVSVRSAGTNARSVASARTAESPARDASSGSNSTITSDGVRSQADSSARHKEMLDRKLSFFTPNPNNQEMLHQLGRSSIRVDQVVHVDEDTTEQRSAAAHMFSCGRGNAGGARFVAYSIVVKMNTGATWRVQRRYREFRNLRRHLGSDVSQLAFLFPDKTPFGRACSERELATRKTRLMGWLQGVLKLVHQGVIAEESGRRLHAFLAPEEQSTDSGARSNSYYGGSRSSRASASGSSTTFDDGEVVHTPSLHDDDSSSVADLDDDSDGSGCSSIADMDDLGAQLVTQQKIIRTDSASSYAEM